MINCSSSFAILFAKYLGAHRHTLQCEMIPILDMNRRPQPQHNRGQWFRWWKPLAFLRNLFVSSLCLFGIFEECYFFSWTAVLQLFLSATSVQMSGSISVLTKGLLSSSLNRWRGNPRVLLPGESIEKRNKNSRQNSNNWKAANINLNHIKSII